MLQKAAIMLAANPRESEMLTNVQIANLERAARKRAEKEGRIIGAIQKADRRGATLNEIADSTGIPLKTVYQYLGELHEDERIHVGLWRVEGIRVKRAYVCGPGEDAKRISLDDIRDDRLEDEILAETLEEHRRWADSWKPRRADAVWF
ncbi:winged helix-turn-helix transcriptional regulator, partial [Cupriavidus sp. D39]|uniref:winged helix-turn-helix transcriptional regulator n=1 Tax=Cupriavidus sp. D39 TaxID=2997877 RepID=UPI0022701738